MTKHVKCEGSFFQSVPVYIFFIVVLQVPQIILLN